MCAREALLSASIRPKCSVCLPIRRRRRMRLHWKRERRVGDDAANSFQPCARSASGSVRCRVDHAALNVIRSKELARCTPEVVQCALRAAVALRSPVPPTCAPTRRNDASDSELPFPLWPQCRLTSRRCSARRSSRSTSQASKSSCLTSVKGSRRVAAPRAGSCGTRSRRGSGERVFVAPLPLYATGCLSRADACPTKSAQSSPGNVFLENRRVATHSDRRCPRTSRSSAIRSRYVKCGSAAIPEVAVSDLFPGTHVSPLICYSTRTPRGTL